MIELDEEARARIVRDATEWNNRENVAHKAIDAVLSHLNTPEAPDAYVALGKAFEDAWMADPAERRVAAYFADYLRKRDARILARMAGPLDPSHFNELRKAMEARS